MSYHAAKEAAEDIQRYINAESDPVMWNVSVALGQLSLALEHDMNDIKQRLRKIEQYVQQL